MLATPTSEQRQNLEKITALLGRNPRATKMAEDLWRFFGYQLSCLRDPSSETSRIKYGIEKDYLPELKASSVAPTVVLADSDRQEEALVHELLHLEIVRRGYPRVYFDKNGCRDAALAQGITNCADHEAMLPLFLDLGYAADRFLTLAELSDFSQQMLKKIKALPDLDTPDGYALSVSACLREHGFSFRLLHVRP